MSQDINRVILSGRCGDDPEFFSTRNGGEVAKVNIAVNVWKGSDRGEETIWVKLVWFGKRNAVCEYIHKGDLIIVEGQLEISHVDDKWYTSVLVENTTLTSSGGGKKSRDRDDDDAYDDEGKPSYGGKRSGGSKHSGRSGRSSSRSSGRREKTSGRGRKSRTPF